jgi:hypothetical protein
LRRRLRCCKPPFDRQHLIVSDARPGYGEVTIAKHFANRAIEADYFRTSLPNTAANTQNLLRWAFRVTYHITGH